MQHTIQYKTEFEYPGDIVWACAAAATRINGGYRRATDNNTDVHPANRALILQFLESYRSNTLRKTQVTDDDYDDGKRAQDYWQSQVLTLLDDNANGYLRACTAVAHKEKINEIKDFGVIASAVQAAYREFNNARLIKLKNSINSQHIHSIGVRVEFDCVIDVIDTNYIDKIGVFAIESIVEGNLYTWWSKTRIESRKYSFLKGRVKQLKLDYRTNQPVTQLNYVKVSK